VRLESECLKIITRVELCLLERVCGVRLETASLKRVKRVELCLLERVCGVRLETASLKRVKRVELCILGKLQQFNVRILHYKIGLHFRWKILYVNNKKILTTKSLQK
jgi:hypothetical protein